MVRVGITGQSGFLGSYLYNTLGLLPDEFERINFDKQSFDIPELLDQFVKNCDVIVHLAAVNRHEKQEDLYRINVHLAEKLCSSISRTKSKVHVLFSSSTQEERDNLYGKAKKECRKILSRCVKENNGTFTGMIIPNVFGPFGKPNYNSFVATFCYKLTHNETPVINNDDELDLIYVGDLVDEIIKQIREKNSSERFIIRNTTNQKVSEVFTKLLYFKKVYYDQGEIPILQSKFDYQLFNTFRSFIDVAKYFPAKLNKHSDDRGDFVELIRLGTGGQCSFSTTYPGITRGNHFHTRKIERFAVIKGKALIQMRKIDENTTFEFYVNGEEPAYVDMPIWYTHNIKNIGEDELLTVFWINEKFDPEDSDTYYLEV